MLMQLLLAALGVSVTLAIHVGALAWLFRHGRPELTLPRMTLVAFALLFAHLLAIIAYAALLRVAVELGLGELRGELRGPGTDYFYFSAVTYTTVGFGDLTPSPGLRLLTAVEALNGIVMAGVTTSAMLVLLSRALERRVPGRASAASGPGLTIPATRAPATELGDPHDQALDEREQARD